MPESSPLFEKKCTGTKIFRTFSLKGLTKRVRQPRALSVEELQRLWTHLDGDTLTISIVAASLGLRASEMLGLRWEDFDWKSLRVKRCFSSFARMSGVMGTDDTLCLVGLWRDGTAKLLLPPIAQAWTICPSSQAGEKIDCELI
jgi:hypothetical protein